MKRSNSCNFLVIIGSFLKTGRGLLLYGPLFILFFLSSLCQGQSPSFPNALRLDLYGITRGLTALPDPNKLAFSIEYERTFAEFESSRLCASIDLGIYSTFYTFFRVFEWPRPDPIISIPSNGYTIQKDWSTIIGIKYERKILESGKIDFCVGFEPRMELTYSDAFLVPFNVFAPAENVQNTWASPRFRTAAIFRYNSRIGIELLGEILRFRRLGDSRNAWVPRPEINLSFSF